MRTTIRVCRCITASCVAATAGDRAHSSRTQLQHHRTQLRERESRRLDILACVCVPAHVHACVRVCVWRLMFSHPWYCSLLPCALCPVPRAPCKPGIGEFQATVGGLIETVLNLSKAVEAEKLQASLHTAACWTCLACCYLRPQPNWCPSLSLSLARAHARSLFRHTTFALADGEWPAWL